MGEDVGSAVSGARTPDASAHHVAGFVNFERFTTFVDSTEEEGAADANTSKLLSRVRDRRIELKNKLSGRDAERVSVYTQDDEDDEDDDRTAIADQLLDGRRRR